MVTTDQNQVPATIPPTTVTLNLSASKSNPALYTTGTSAPPTVTTTTTTPINQPPQKLFFRPGTIEEEDEEVSVAEYEDARFFSRVDSPLLYRNPQSFVAPGTPGASSLFRVNTCNSSLTVYATGRQDSSRLVEKKRGDFDHAGNHIESPGI